MRAILIALMFEALFINIGTHVAAAGADPGQYIRLGRQALKEDHPSQARLYFLSALSMLHEHPNHSLDNQISALSGLGYADLWLGNQSEAKKSYSEGLHLAHDAMDRATMRLGLARALNDLGRPRQAYCLLRDHSIDHHDAALQAAISASLLGWNARSTDLLHEAAPNGVYIGPNWQRKLYNQTNKAIGFKMKPHVNVGFQYSGDSDHNTEQTYQAGMTFPSSGFGDNSLSPAVWSIGYQQSQIHGTIGEIGMDTLSGSVAAPLNSDWNYSLQAGLGLTRAWAFSAVTGRLSYHPDDDWGLELGFDRQPIETIQATANHILVNTFSFEGFRQLPLLGTVSASYFNQHFSDENQRNGFVTRITPTFYSFNPIPIAIGLQGYYRYYESGQARLNDYFNPRHYSEAICYIIYEQKFLPQWMLKIHAGFGSQTADNTTIPVKDIYGTITGSVLPYFQVDLKAGYSEVASSSGGGAGYNVNYVMADISVPF